MGAIQVKAPSTQGTRSRLARGQSRAGTVDPGGFTPRLRAYLQQAHLRLARGPARTGFAVKQPWPDRLANRPYRRSIQCKDRLTPYPDACSSVGRAEVTTVTSPSPLTDLTGKQRCMPCSDCCARVRLTAAESSLRRHRKLRLARPQGSDSTSTSEDGLRLARPQGSASTSTSEESPPCPTLGSDRPRYRGYIITLPLASSGYGEQDRCPIWLALVNK
jgi:hypothetical protein